MKMLCTRWVLDLLSIDQKLIRMLVSQACLDRFKQNKKDFARRFLTAYETWIHHYTSEQKKKKVETSLLHQQVMGLIFWDYKKILIIIYC